MRKSVRQLLIIHLQSPNRFRCAKSLPVRRIDNNRTVAHCPFSSRWHSHNTHFKVAPPVKARRDQYRKTGAPIHLASPDSRPCRHTILQFALLSASATFQRSTPPSEPPAVIRCEFVLRSYTPAKRSSRTSFSRGSLRPNSLF